MDPIITPALLAAILVAMKDKAVGAASDMLFDAVKVQAAKLRGLLPDGNNEKLARALVDHVLAETAAYPPERALVVEPLATSGVVGIWAPRGRLQLHLLWVNHADFPIRVRDVHVTARVGPKGCEWDQTKGDEFTLAARSSERRQLNVDPHEAMPSFERGGVQCELTVGALVTGPWDGGRAQQTRGLVQVSTWVPALGFEPTGVITGERDVDITIAEYLQGLVDHAERRVRIVYTELDSTLKLRPGSTKARLAAVAAQKHHRVEAGDVVAVVKLHHPVEYLDDYDARSHFGDDYD